MKRIRLKDFLTEDELSEIIAQEDTLMFDLFADYLDNPLEAEHIYFLEHSFNKYVSNFAILLQNDVTIRRNFWVKIGNAILTKYREKWSHIVNALNIDYDPDFSYYHLKEKTHGLTISDGGTDTTAYNSNTTITENDSSTTNDSVYAFNSVSDVPSAKSSDVGNTQSTNLRGGQDTFTSQNTKQHSGTDSTLMQGHDRVVSKLLTDEIEFRNKFILYDIIFKDIDSILTLQIY